METPWYFKLLSLRLLVRLKFRVRNRNADERTLETIYFNVYRSVSFYFELIRT